MDVLDKPTFASNTPSNQSIAIKYGLIWAGVSALMILVGFITGNDPSLPTASLSMKILNGVIGFAVPIVAITLGLLEDRKQLGGFLTLGRGVGGGVKIGLVAGIASAIFFLLYQYVINPGYQDQLKETMISEWERQGLNDEQIEMASKMAFMFTNPAIMSIFQIAGALFFGVLLGLICGAILKREPIR